MDIIFLILIFFVGIDLVAGLLTQFIGKYLYTVTFKQEVHTPPRSSEVFLFRLIGFIVLLAFAIIVSKVV
jgi:hypothetical protein